MDIVAGRKRRSSRIRPAVAMLHFIFHRTASFHRLRLSQTVTLVLALIFFYPPPTARADKGGWDFDSYRIQITIAIDAPGGLAEQLADELPRYLRNRIDASLIPLWQCNVHIAAGRDRAQVFASMAAPSDAPPPKLSDDQDKLMLATVRWTPEVVELTAREFDRYVQRWSVPIRCQSRQDDALPEQFFVLISRTFSPLAQLEVDPKDPQHAILKPRGGLLPRAKGAAPLATPGDVFLPILRRTTRGGQVDKNGLQPVPWTYVDVTEVKDNTIVGRFQSANRRPFSGKRQGRVEQLAIALRADPDTTTLRLHSRRAVDKPIIGYEVFSQLPGQEATTRIGLSDTAGQIAVEPIKTPIQFLLVKHGGQLLARVPIVNGAQPRVEVPLPDDDARLAAEARLAAVREDLIDVVARRNILMSRARQKIKKKDFKGAEELMRALDDLPARPQFNATVDTAKQTLRSDDPQMQKRIDQLFETTQRLLTQYLDLKPINEVKNELREAQAGKVTSVNKDAGNAQGGGTSTATAGGIPKSNPAENVRVSALLEARKNFKTVLKPEAGERQPLPQPPDKTLKIIKYPAPSGELSAYLTSDPGDGKKHPAIIWITGGDCNSIGDVWSRAPRENDQTAAPYRQAGIVMMYPSLRGGNDNPGVKEGFLGEVDDVLAAVDYLQKQPYVDPARTYLGGHSSGGTMVLLVAECSDRFRAVFSFGPTNDVSGYAGYPGLLPFDVDNPSEIRMRSPGYWLESIQSPVWVMEGVERTSNIKALRTMSSASTSPKAHFIEVRGVNHFSILAPTNEVIAKKILTDTSDVSEFSLSSDDIGGVGLDKVAAQDSAQPTGEVASSAIESPTRVEGWRRVEHGTLSVQMPSEPIKKSKVDNTPQGERRSTEYSLDKTTHAYVFNVTEYPNALKVTNPFLDAMRDAMINASHGQMVSSTHMEVRGKPAIEFSYTGTHIKSTTGPDIPMVGYMRILVSGNKLIMLLIVGVPAESNQEAAKRFWDTFSIAEPGQSR
jgi:acetyl esterase/lipase